MTTMKEQLTADAELFISDDDDVTPWTESILYEAKNGDGTFQAAKAIRAAIDPELDGVERSTVERTGGMYIRSDAVKGIEQPKSGDKGTLRGRTFRVREVLELTLGIHSLDVDVSPAT